MISVIVPVYNRERTLRKCIDSILSTNYNDIEIIIVDDGSCDDSWHICQEYAAIDSRIITIHKENGGVSSARNVGIEAAHGNWITFVDSDDIILPSHFDIVKIADELDLAMVGHQFGRYDDGTFILDNYEPEINKDPQRLSSQEEVVSWLFGEFNPYQHQFFYCHDKFFRREIIRLNSICFPEDCTLGEDQVFVCRYLNYCHSLLYSNTPSYVRINWVQNESGYSLGGMKRSVDNYLKNIEINNKALSSLAESTKNVLVKEYAVNYLLNRPFRFFVRCNYSSWNVFRTHWVEMKNALVAAKPIMSKEVTNIKFLRKWEDRWLVRSLFACGIDITLSLAWIIRNVDYLVEGVRYRLSRYVP